jgi:hypothetical protein
MKASEVAATLVNGNIADARDAVADAWGDDSAGRNARRWTAAFALDVFDELINSGIPPDEAWRRLRRCLDLPIP